MVQSIQIPYLDLKSQYNSIKDEIMPAVEKVFDSQEFCLGSAVSEFEEKVASYCDSKHAIGVSSGSDALLVSLMALGIKPSDEVITSSFTFFATAGSIARLGAKPIFVDVEEETFNIDSSKIANLITEKSKAIIPVHLYGQIAEMEPILKIAEKNNLAVIEDACQSIGASQGGKKAGNFGEAGCFSFYPTKNLGAFGDGGLVTTNKDELAEKIRILRDHGQNPRYFYNMIGGNFRLDGIQGAVLTVKLKYLEQWNKKRRENAALYDELLADCPVKTPIINANNVSVYHQYTIRAPKRDKLQEYLSQHSILTAVFYPKPLHLQKCFDYLGYKEGDLPVTERLCKEVLSLPVYAEMEDEQIRYVAEKIIEFYS